MPNVIGPGTASCSTTSTGLRTPRALASCATSSRRHAVGKPVRRIIDSRHNTAATGIKNAIVPASQAARRTSAIDTAGDSGRGALVAVAIGSPAADGNEALAAAGALGVTGTSMVMAGATASRTGNAINAANALAITRWRA